MACKSLVGFGFGFDVGFDVSFDVGFYVDFDVGLEVDVDHDEEFFSRKASLAIVQSPRLGLVLTLNSA
ncbi:hypothetical protein [Actimicrobium antarcticum]|uniref:Outer membrane protein beta-barrel domain-containing protein n=1 Tax=Actimicrobium antarcticum TaxID=1051899 RepID=A0ABP7SMV7_9BURK